MNRYFSIAVTIILLMIYRNGNAQEIKPHSSKFEGCILIIEHKPQFPGGDTALFNFIRLNLQYPEKSRGICVEGTVYLGFTVGTDGTLSDIKIKRGLGGGCSEEALRVVKLMPKWKPGTQNGKPVRVNFTIPIKFKLE